MTVVTAQGTSYALKVSDFSKFLTFGNDYLSDNVSFNLFEYIYNSFNIKTSNSNSLNEINFLQLLNQLDSGLKLFKGNSIYFNNWTPIDLSTSNTIIQKDC